MNINKNSESGQNQPDEDRLSWHPAFYEAIQLELDEYSDILEFTSDHQLTDEPLRIDVLIIRKTSDVVIKKNIASIFRTVNIVEYKSPDDYVSVKDFYRVYGYACLYTALNDVSIKDLSLTFIESRHPRELLAHLQETRGYTVEERWPGIYIIDGDILPIQIIDSRKLSVEENTLLKGLNKKLKASELQQVITEIQRRGKESRTKAYFDILFRANLKQLEEANKMDKYMAFLNRVFEESGRGPEWEAKGIAKGITQGKAEKAKEFAQNLLQDGFSLEQTAKYTGLDVEKVRTLAST
jgi:hypothetical protein